MTKHLFAKAEALFSGKGSPSGVRDSGDIPLTEKGTDAEKGSSDLGS